MKAEGESVNCAAEVVGNVITHPTEFDFRKWTGGRKPRRKLKDVLA
jgi:hypothetical protein